MRELVVEVVKFLEGLQYKKLEMLLLLLRSGALLASVTLFGKKCWTIFGADSIKASMIALVSGTALIFFIYDVLL